MFCGRCGASIGQAAQPSEGPQEGSAEPSAYEEPSAYDHDRVESCRLQKCPACGEPLDDDVWVCPACSYPVPSMTASKAVNELIQSLSKVEADASDKAAGYAQVVKEIDNFVIPTTANGILTFLIFAKSRLITAARDYGQGWTAKDAVSQAWVAKAQYAYDVARLKFSDASEFNDIDTAYRSIKAIANRNNVFRGAVSTAEAVKNGGCLIKFIAFYVVILAMGIVIKLLGFLSLRPQYVWVLLALVVAGLGICFYKRKQGR